MPDEAILLALIFVAALLYSCVGHAGASGYTAILLLHGFAPESIRPAVLVMNILVATITTWRFYRAGYFDWDFFWPLALASTPFALLGGSIRVSAHVLYLLIGVILLASAVRMLVDLKEREGPAKRPVRSVLLLVGGLLGLLAGLSGTGGGIFLTPLLVLTGWRNAKESAAISSAFIWVNSLAGLTGHALAIGLRIEPIAWLWLLAALAGGVVGSDLGSRRLTPWWLKRVMAVVLLIAAYHLIAGKPPAKAKETPLAPAAAREQTPPK